MIFLSQVLITVYRHVYVWHYTGFGLLNWFIDHLYTRLGTTRTLSLISTLYGKPMKPKRRNTRQTHQGEQYLWIKSGSTLDGETADCERQIFCTITQTVHKKFRPVYILLSADISEPLQYNYVYRSVSKKLFKQSCFTVRIPGGIPTIMTKVFMAFLEQMSE
jgi:hypothetical protein